MANPQLTVSQDPDLFLDFLLRCALTAPGAATSPTAGRILARLLVVGAIEGGDDLITPYLVPLPGEDAVFEVRAYRPGNLEPTEVRSGLRAAAALRIALRAARDSDDGIEVLSQTSAGLERCVLVRDSTGDFEFRFAGSETLSGPPSVCAAARSAWDSALVEWRAWVAEEHPTPVSHPRTGQFQPDELGPAPVEPPAEPVLRPAPAEPPAEPVLTGPFEQPVEPQFQTPVEPAADLEWQAVDPVREADGMSGRPHPPTHQSGWWIPELDDLEDASLAFDEAMPGASDRPGATGIEPEPGAGMGRTTAAVGVPSEPIPPTTTGAQVAGAEPDRGSEPGGPGAVAPWARSDVDTVISALQDSLAQLTVKPDLSQVEELIARAMSGDRDLVEPLARRLSSRLGESLGRSDPREFIDALLPLIPRPGEVAEAVTADVTALLSEVMLRRRPGELSTGLEGQGIIGAIEQLQVQMDGVRDQLRKSTGVLQSIDERMEVTDRRASAAERIGASMEQEMQRLALRIDEQVAALAASAGGSELADGVARLTRKLRQSVAQLDRALVRLDDVVEHPAVAPASPASPTSPARPAIPAAPATAGAANRPAVPAVAPSRPVGPAAAPSTTAPAAPVGPARPRRRY